MHVEIWSDIACPWCHIGKRRLETALAAFEHRDEVQVTWRSFELDPAAAPELQGDRVQHLADKYGISLEKAHAMERQITDVAADEGLDFHFEIARDGSTFDAHRLLHLAHDRGVQDALKERLFRAYLSEGQLMGDRETLVRLAVEAGLDEDEVRATLTSDAYAADVREDERTAASLGISAVPFFVVDRAFGASGAQPPELLGELLQRAWDASRPALSIVAEGDSCGIDGC